MRALEKALVQDRARNEAQEKTHQEALAKARGDAAKNKAIEAVQKKVAMEIAQTEAQLRALEAAKGRLQSSCEDGAACARDEANRRVPGATAAAMEEAEKKINRAT